MNIDLRLGDCLEIMKTIEDNSIEAIITHRPKHLHTTDGIRFRFNEFYTLLLTLRGASGWWLRILGGVGSTPNKAFQVRLLTPLIVYNK